MHDMNGSVEPQVPDEQDAEATGHRLPQDPLLTVLVQAVDHAPGWEIGMTLHVNGMIVSGLMCSMTSFFEEQAELIRSLGSPETSDTRRQFAEIFDELAEQNQTQLDAEHAEGTEATEIGIAGAEPPEFIHLRAATVHAPGTNAVLPATLWRGRLEHVSGWSIGNFGPKPPPRMRTDAEQISA